MAVDTRSIVWVDAGGNSVITRVNSQGGAAGIMADALAVSNADWQQDWEGGLSVNGTPSPTAAEYSPANVVAQFVFTTTSPGVLVTLRVPSPQIGIFLADGRTVDLTNAAVLTLIAACVGTLCNDAGDTATACIAGFIG